MIFGTVAFAEKRGLFTEMGKKVCKKTSIGGQAVLEGVMMRGKTGMATAVRDTEGTIRVEAERIPQKKSAILKFPIIRGAVSFISSLYSGTKILMRSAAVYGEEEGEPSKFEKWLAKTFHADVMKVAMTLGVILGLAVSIFLFFFIPSLIGGVFSEYVTDDILLVNLFEGLIRIAIFISYIVLISFLKDIRRTFMYHGAEHKTITCYEKGLELTVENVRGCRRVHDRCGTTFTFFVMTVSILVFSLFEAIPWVHGVVGTYRIVKALFKVALLPIVAGLSYELLKFLAKTNFFLFVPLKLPGLGLQMLTTREPDDGMIEVAITAFKKALAMDEDPEEPVCSFVCPEKLVKLTEDIKKKLAEKGIDEADAEWIVSLSSGYKRSELNKDVTVGGKAIDKANALADERLTGKPLAYILGNADFYGYEIKVDERALIPRPETEELVERAIGRIEKDCAVLDLCTGSGAIAIAVKLKTGAAVTASDVSEDALKLARENAEKLGAEINFVKSDMFENIDGKFDVIISNPPYIKSGDIQKLQTEVKDFEPSLALDGGEDGLDFYRIIAANARGYLNEKGTVFLEVGEGQAESVKNMFDGFFVDVIKDLNGVDRIIKAVMI